MWLTQAQRKVVADLLPKLADRLKLDQKNPCTMSFNAKELESIRDRAEAARPHAQNGMVRNSLRHVVDAVTKAPKNPKESVVLAAGLLNSWGLTHRTGIRQLFLGAGVRL